MCVCVCVFMCVCVCMFMCVCVSCVCFIINGQLFLAMFIFLLVFFNAIMSYDYYFTSIKLCCIIIYHVS